MPKKWYETLMVFILAGVLGLLSLTLPTLLTSGIKSYESIAGNGIISVTYLDSKVVGWGVNWKTYTEPGLGIIIDGTEYKIKEVNDNNTITLINPYMGETSKKGSYSLAYPRRFPFIDEARSHLYSFSGIITLFLIGLVFGCLWSKHKWLWGIGTVSFFPIFSVVEMFMDPYSHNLFPFEFFVYGFMVIPGIVGAYTGAFIRRKFVRPNKT